MRFPTLSEPGAVFVAFAAAAGAWLSHAVPLWVVAVSMGAFAALRRPVLLVLTVGLLASFLGARAWAGMVPPTPRAVEGLATLVDDPERVSGAVRVEVRLDGRHFQAWSRGAPAVVLERRLAGERVRVAGEVLPGTAPDWLRIRHVVGMVQFDTVELHDGGGPISLLANGLRRSLARGARSLEPEQRALFTGLVVGDDRAQSTETRDDFRGSGLSHLLAVSGQNVAFVLTLAAPVLERLGLRTRWVATIALLMLFATVTRFEPSVLRATAMAGLATTASGLGRPASSLRILALAVGALVLVDPFLVRSVGFGLSVSASAGIVLLRQPIARAIPGPEWWRNAVAVIVAAQLAVAPLLIAAFGGVPVAALPANLLAEPVAGIVMMWGASAGVLAGWAPTAFADVIHAPMAIALWWIGSVARWTTDARLGEIGVVGTVVAVVAGSIAVLLRRRRALTTACLALIVIVLATPAVSVRRSANESGRIDGAGTIRRHAAHGTVLDVSTDAYPAGALRALRRAGVAQLDTVVLPSDQSTMRAVVTMLGRRLDIGRVVVAARAPPR